MYFQSDVEDASVNLGDFLMQRIGLEPNYRCHLYSTISHLLYFIALSLLMLHHHYYHYYCHCYYYYQYCNHYHHFYSLVLKYTNTMLNYLQYACRISKYSSEARDVRDV